jgi:hypothetical protein
MAERLCIYLDNIESFPTDIKTASIVSGLPKYLVKGCLNDSRYFVLNDKIYNFEKVKLSEVEEICKQGYSFLIEDGHMMKLNNESNLCI